MGAHVGLIVLDALRYPLPFDHPRFVPPSSEVGVSEQVPAVFKGAGQTETRSKPSVFEQIGDGDLGQPTEAWLHGDVASVCLIERGPERVIQLTCDGFNGVIQSVITGFG